MLVSSNAYFKSSKTLNRVFYSFKSQEKSSISVRNGDINDKKFIMDSICQLVQIGENLDRVPKIIGLDQIFDEIINDTNNNTIFIAEDSNSNKKLGAAIISIHKALHLGGKYACLEELIIDPSARGLGIGTELLKKAEDFALKNGMVSLELTQPPRSSKFDNERSKFYAKNGYNTETISRGKRFKEFFKTD